MTYFINPPHPCPYVGVYMRHIMREVYNIPSVVERVAAVRRARAWAGEAWTRSNTRHGRWWFNLEHKLDGALVAMTCLSDDPSLNPHVRRATS